MEQQSVYLDQNHWIYLAQDYWGKPHKLEHKGLAAKLLELVNSDRVLLPLSTIHFIEHLRAESATRRQRLAQVLDQYSHGWHMASWASVLPVEICRAVLNAFDERFAMPQTEVLGKGFLFGLGPKEKALLLEGRNEQRLNLLESIATLPGAILDLLTFPNESGRQRQNAVVAQLSHENAASAEELRSLRKPHSIEVHRRAQYAGYTLQHQGLVLRALDAIGRTRDDFFNLGLEGLTRFWCDVPSLDVDCELTLYRDRQWSKPADSNDVRDLAHLALAIPYCDVVVTERFWVRATQETGIAKKYGTVVCADLTDMVQHLGRA